MISNNFINKHNGPRKQEVEKMLKKIGVKSIDELIGQTIPQSIRLSKPMNLPDGLNEIEYINHLKAIGSRNEVFKSFIGLGYLKIRAGTHLTPLTRQRFRKAAWKLCLITKPWFRI
jgi:glycine dehydrogenase